MLYILHSYQHNFISLIFTDTLIQNYFSLTKHVIISMYNTALYVDIYSYHTLFMSGLPWHVLITVEHVVIQNWHLTCWVGGLWRIEILFKNQYEIVDGRDSGLKVSAFNSGSRSPGRGHCVVFLGMTLYSHSVSLHPGV